ncbi:MAG TPA: superoxide dismutase [Patescibacteria group bacterium]|nr:superoxide dismutase [Patescibacteria group bacterium]
MFTLPELPYGYDALSSAISEKIMKLHHDNHHQTYVDNLNKAVASEESIKDKSIEDLLTNLDEIPESVRGTVRNHGGGHFNHSFFWQIMAPNSSGQPNGQLKNELVSKYGDWQSFIDKFSESATKIFGSGWAWLMPDLSIETTPNQDNPIMNGEKAPILGLDVWEHAYYLDYTFKRADYIKAWWNVVNWSEVESRFSK